MKIRPFGLRDIFLLNSYRHRGLFLDAQRMLIHGSAQVPMGAFFTFLGPTTRIFTYRYNNHTGLPLIAQASYVRGDTCARLSYMAPENAIEMADLSDVTDYLAVVMGRQGAFHILADIDESSQVYPLLRRVGFATYARQRIWRMDGEPAGAAEEAAWRPCRARDVIGAQSLYCNVVPGLVQQVEPLPKKNLRGMVHYQNGDLRAYVDLVYGRNGIWIQPFVHPDVQGFDKHLMYLLRDLPGRHERPLYICIRSYQSWLEEAIEAMGAQPGPGQAVMVRHLTVSRRVKQAYPLPAIDGTRPEPTAPIAHSEETRRKELAEGEKYPSTDSIY